MYFANEPSVRVSMSLAADTADSTGLSGTATIRVFVASRAASGLNTTTWSVVRASFTSCKGGGVALSPFRSHLISHFPSRTFHLALSLPAQFGAQSGPGLKPSDQGLRFLLNAILSADALHWANMRQRVSVEAAWRGRSKTIGGASWASRGLTSQQRARCRPACSRLGCVSLQRSRTEMRALKKPPCPLVFSSRRAALRHRGWREARGAAAAGAHSAPPLLPGALAILPALVALRAPPELGRTRRESQQGRGSSAWNGRTA